MPGRRIAISKMRRLAAFHIGERSPSLSLLSRLLRISRSTARTYRVRIRQSGYSFEQFAALRPHEIRAAFTQRERGRRPGKRFLDLLEVFPHVHADVSAGRMNLKQAWSRYRDQHAGGYGYSQFAVHFAVWHKNQGLAAVRCCKWRISHVAEQDIRELAKWRRSNNRTKWAKAVVVMEAHRGTGPTTLAQKVEKSPRLVKRWIGEYERGGMAALRQERTKRPGAERIASIKQKRDRIVALLHETPQIHGINRSSWSLKTLAQAFKKQYGESIGKSTLSEYVTAEGYTFRKARRVLTSPDPNYREKLKEITRVLSNLNPDEKFFSIDEFGPFSIKMRGGLALTLRGTTRVVPQRQRSRGRLIVTAALELSTNQITHFYSQKKNTDEMLKLLDVLLRKYADQRCLYLSWDAASWHVSGRLAKRVSEVNGGCDTCAPRTPRVQLMPLPCSAQFLNVIESVFSGMARAILHNSDYQSSEDCMAAIDKYFAERNEAYTRDPKRAGKKIWGAELVEPCFTPSNNCKDPNWR